MEATHVVIPIDLYKQLGQFLTSLPYSQVARVIPAIEQNSEAVIYDDDLGMGPHYRSVSDGDSGGE